MDKIILASASPRRAEILKNIGLEFKVKSFEIDESPYEKEHPEDYVKRISEGKLKEALKFFKDNKYIIITADTVVYKDKFLQKPKSKKEAIDMLRLISGTDHYVYSAISVSKNHKILTKLSKTRVVFHNMNDEEINWYVNTGEPMDKAGAYGIQGLGSIFIKRIEGSYHNVVGFPIDVFYNIIKEMNINILIRS